MGRNKDSLIALAEKLTGENCGNVLTKKDALKKIACFYAGEEVECNTVADALECIAEHCSGGGGSSESAIEYIKAYIFYDENDTAVILFSFKDVVEGFNILFSGDGSGGLSTLPVEITEINGDSFVYDGATFTRDRTKDLLIFAKNEQVEVELVSGYDTGITSYNFATETDSNGSITENQRFNDLKYYDGVIDCDLVIYVGSGRVAYYNIKQ